MTAVKLPDPVVGIPDTGAVDVAGLARDLAAEVDGEVRFDAGSRAAYSTDASNYRQVPIGVVVPRTVEAGVAAVAVCARYGAPITSRGGGTSLAGECTNVAVIIDWSKYCHRLLEVDADNAILTCDSGTVATWAARHFTIRGDRQFYLSGNLATMAPGLPYATGMQNAFRGHQVIAYVGYGGFAMLMAQ